MNSENNQTNINWYPGHMAKTKKQLIDMMSLVDVVYELIDSRIPYSSKLNDINELIKNKKSILVFTKYDLCDKVQTNKWIKYYSDNGYTTVILNLKNNHDYKQLIDITNDLMKESLIKLANKGVNKSTINALAIGVPNVGKSTLINALANKKVANVGNTPGITRQINWLNTNSNIKIMDTPGILWPKLEKTVAFNLASTGAIKTDILPLEEVAIYILNFLNEYYRQILVDRYKIDNLDDIDEVFNIIGKNIGAFRNGESDYTRVSLAIINDIKNEVIKGITFDRK